MLNIRTHGQFLSQTKLVWIQGFPSPRLVTSTRLKNPVCSTAYPYLRRTDGFMSLPKALVKF